MKILGYRIELREIEGVISSYKGVNQCAVLAKPLLAERNQLSLICYYLASSPIPEERFIHFVQTKLPKQMIPKIYIHLDRFPLTVNGKLDEKALPIPQMAALDLNISPRNALEKQILLVWIDILGDDHSIGIDHDFFKIGGNSLLAAKLIHRLKIELCPTLNVKDIFIYSTVRSLSSHIQNLNSTTDSLRMIPQFVDFEPFHILNQNRLSPPLFLFPPATGGIESYVNNIGKFLSDYKLILFENIYEYIAKNFSLITANTFSVEKLAHIYVALIQSVAPKGPYQFFGWSFGGVLALEVAKQLAAKCGIIKNIFLVDPLFCLNTVMKEMCIESQDISFKYVPSFEVVDFVENVVLFKATKVPNNGEQRKIFEYYVEKANYNHMDAFLSPDRFRTIPLLHDHFSWIKNRQELEKMCAIIRECLQ